jgi:L-alanine-DL-glutamate epimerase-like enolase superfamily enzyme
MEKFNTFLYSKAAIDIALHDIAGKAYGVPVAYLLGGIVRKSFGVSRSVPMVAPEDIGDIAKKIVDQGYKLITIKTGIEPDMDLARVKAVRKAVGDTFPLEVDCNMGYLPDVAIRYLSQMEDYGIIAVEQPGPWWDLDGMAEVTRALKMSVIADESVLSEVEAINVVRRRAADTICIKVAKNGGLAPAKRIATIAGAAAMSVNMGSEHPAGIGTAAMAHYWASTSQLIDSVGYGSPLERFTDDIIKEPIKFKDGIVHLPEGPGLGVELDESKLEKWKIQIDLP